MAKSVDTTNETVVQKSSTRWDAFEKAQLKIVSACCQAYKPFHAFDMSCHTRFPLTVDNIIRHIEGEHGGGFEIKLERTEGKPSPLWRALADAGIEAVDVRCEVCGKELAPNPQVLLNHLFKAHPGNMRRPRVTSTLFVTFGHTKPVPKDDEFEFTD